MFTKRISVALTVFTLGGTLTSCATKKYVGTQITPVTARVQKVEAKNGEQDQQIDVLEKESSRTRENLVDLKGNVDKIDGRLKTTTETAQGAASAASQAQQQAADARQYASTRADAIEKTIDNLDQYKLSKTTSVLFDTGRSTLTTEGKSTLDGVAQQARNIRRYAFEIEGFTDSTGNATRNISLSQERAENVARYLTVEHQVPLRNIHMIGAGSAAPVADNKTRNGRKQNRRVEVRLFVQEAGATVTSAAAAVR